MLNWVNNIETRVGAYLSSNKLSDFHYRIVCVFVNNNPVKETPIFVYIFCWCKAGTVCVCVYCCCCETSTVCHCYKASTMCDCFCKACTACGCCCKASIVYGCLVKLILRVVVVVNSNFCLYWPYTCYCLHSSNVHLLLIKKKIFQLHSTTQKKRNIANKT